jgi:hypothetical protein
MKTLNPAAPLTIAGVPDAELASRVIKHYERTVTIQFAAAAANWNADIMLYANPWTPSAFLTDDGVAPTVTQVLNTQLGATSELVRQFIFENTEAYRVIYGSMTAIMDATSLTNSGLVAATQYTMVPKQLYLDTTVANRLRISNRCWPDPPRNYDQLIQMPGTYIGQAKDGVYLPLRLDIEEPWVRTNDYYAHYSTDDTIILGADAYNFYSGAQAAVATPASFPFGLSGTSQAATVFEYPNSQPNIGHISFRNITPTAALRITYRIGVEFLVPPGTLFASDIQLPPSYDPTSIEMYKRVSTKLKLAYSADYNDWQKIVGAIKAAAHTILPMIPAGNMLTGLIDPAAAAALKLGAFVKKKAAARKAAKESKYNRLIAAVTGGASSSKKPKPKPKRRIRMKLGKGGAYATALLGK